jgi:hypothetical protein
MRLAALLLTVFALTSCGSGRTSQAPVTVTVTKTAAPAKPSRGDRLAITKVVRGECPKGGKCVVSDIRFAKSDPTYATADIYDAKIGGAYVMLHEDGDRWRVISGPGSSDVGCDRAPKRIRLDLALDCQRDRKNGGAQSATPPPATVASPSPADPYKGHPGDKHFAVYVLQVKDDGLGDIGGIARVKNVSSTSLTGTFTFTFFQSGQVIGTAQGSAQDVSPGQTVTVQLVSSDPMIVGRFRYQFQVDTEF